jgi:hypothetical protein
MGDQPFARPLPAHRTAQTQNKRTQTSMPQVGFKPMIPVSERVKTVHALDRTATVIGTSVSPQSIDTTEHNEQLSLYSAQALCTICK